MLPNAHPLPLHKQSSPTMGLFVSIQALVLVQKFV